MVNKFMEEGIPCLETPRLILRKFDPSDYESYFTYHSSEITTEYYDWVPSTLEDAADDISTITSCYSSKERIQWAICVKGSDSIIGDCGILVDTFGYKGELNYMLSPDYWGNGYMVEALQAVISYCFEYTSFVRIQALTQPANMSSEKLLTKLGLKSEGILKYYGYNPWKDLLIDLEMWSLVKPESKKLINYSIKGYF